MSAVGQKNPFKICVRATNLRYSSASYLRVADFSDTENHRLPPLSHRFCCRRQSDQTQNYGHPAHNLSRTP